MCQESTLQKLSESQKGQLIYCTGCKNYTIYHGTFCITFGDPELRKFFSMLMKLDPDSYNIPMGGQNYVVISHPNVKMGLFLTPEDTSAILQLIGQGQLFEQAINILQ